MTEYEAKLLDIIRTNDNPEQALLIAIDIIIDYLNHHESSESISSVVCRESV
jgi:hypothetical protein